MFPLRTALLRKWLERNGHVATYSELVKGMYSAGQINTIDELVNVLRHNPLSDPAAGPHQIGELNRLGYVDIAYCVIFAIYSNAQPGRLINQPLTELLDGSG